MDAQKKAERAKELEAKKAMLEAYRQKRRLDNNLPTEQKEAKPAPVMQQAEEVLAAVLAGGSSEKVKEETPKKEEEKKEEEKKPAVAVVKEVPVATKVEEVPISLSRGVGVQEAPPRVVESYIRSVQTEQTDLYEGEEGEGAATALVQEEKTEEEKAEEEKRRVEEKKRREEEEEEAKRLEEERLRVAEQAEAKRLREDAKMVAWAERAGEVAERLLRTEELVGIDVLKDLRGGGGGTQQSEAIEEGSVGTKVGMIEDVS
jgi:hypothetical protein